MPLPRSAVILLHPTSLPGGHGCGDFGPVAFAFLDFLKRARMGGWQILPLGPVGTEGSPYQASSSFAGNPLLISLDKLAAAGLLEPADLAGGEALNCAKLDFSAAGAFKAVRLRKAFGNFCKIASKTGQESFLRFKNDQKGWLADYALFAALKTHFQNAAWWQWEAGIAAREAAALQSWREKLAEEVEYQSWLQFAFYVQWGELKKSANAAGIKIIGDVPIYTAHDSADVWAAREYFEVDPKTGEALRLAGAPPDYFCEDGQLWGNPIYNWPRLKADGYGWWIRRMKAALTLCDVVRIDHFRGFEAYWDTPAGEKTARNGQWVPGPGQDFFDALKSGLRAGLPTSAISGEEAELPLIAEDLGVITPEVDKLRLDNGLPGMKVLQFAFCDGANAYRPHTYEKNCVVYTGTHDNDTTRGWYAAQGPDYAHMNSEVLEAERDLCRRYLSADGSNINWDFIRLALGSVADTAVIPMQDVLGLGNDCRMNLPGTATGNWSWRMHSEELQSAPSEYLAMLNEVFDRAPAVE